MAFFIRLSKEERKLTESYAKSHAISLEEAFKQALFERIEDEYDFVVAKEAYHDYVNNGYKSTPVAEFWSELDEELSFKSY